MADQSSGEKSEDATWKKLQDARNRGQVALSQEFIAALMLSAAIGSLLYSGGALIETLGQAIHDATQAIADLGPERLEPGTVLVLIVREASRLALPLGAVLAPILVMGLLAGYGQIGFQISSQAIELQPNKLNPLSGLKRMFSPRSVVKLLQSGAKLGCLALSLWIGVRTQLGPLSGLGGDELGPSLRLGINAEVRVVLIALLAIVVLALIDFFFQRFQFGREMKMSKQEVREEHKSMEGDPAIKGRVRRMQREIASKRMLSAVPQATVVVTNPTHYAVALAYPRDEAGRPQEAAPRVVAKGLDEVAQRIKALAKESGVPLHEDVPLARTLHAQCEVGELIPEALYAAVAAVLQQVWNRSPEALARQRAAEQRLEPVGVGRAGIDGDEVLA